MAENLNLEDPVVAERQKRLDFLSRQPLAGLRQEYKKDAAAGALTPGLEQVYSELVQAAASDRFGGRPAKAIEEEVARGVVQGEDENALVQLAQPFFDAAFVEQRGRTKGQKAAVVAKSLGSMVGEELGAAKDLMVSALPWSDTTTRVMGGGAALDRSPVVVPMLRGAAGAARRLFTSTGLGGATPDEQAVAVREMSSAAEQAVRQNAELAKGIFDGEDDKEFEQKGTESLAGIFKRRVARAKERVKPEFGVGTGASEAVANVFGGTTATPETRPEVAARLQAGYAGEELFTPEQQRIAADMSNVLDPTEIVPFGVGLKIGSKGVQRVLKGAAQGLENSPRLARALNVAAEIAEGLPTGPRQQTLAPVIETVDSALAREVAQAGAVRQARMRAGGGLVELGQRMTRAASGTAATGAAAAAATMLAGGDYEEALAAGLVFSTGRKVFGSRFGAGLVGQGVEKVGRVLQQPFVGPFKDAQRALAQFATDYRPVRSALVAAGAGTAEAGLFALGADSSEEAGQIMGGGAVMGAAGSGLGTLTAFGRDQLVRAALGGPGTASAPAGPVAPLGLNATADAVNAEAVKSLTPAGTGLLASLRALLPGQHVYVALTGDQAQQIYSTLTGDTTTDVRSVNGLNAKAKDGKQLVIMRPAGTGPGIGGQAGGHEVTHALQQAGLASPELRPFWEAVYAEADKALPENSAQYQQLRDDYVERAAADGIVLDPNDREYFLNEFIAETGSVVLSGLPAGKLGGSKSVSTRLARAFLKLGEALALREPGVNREGSGVVTSEALPYSPSVELISVLEKAFDAARLEQSDAVPDASLEAQQAAPAAQAPAAPATGPVDVGTLNPVPRDLTAPAVAPTPVVPPNTVDVGTLNPVPRSLTTDKSMTPLTPPQQRVVAEEVGDVEPVVEPTAPQPEQAPSGAVRGTDVQAARTNLEAPLTTEEKAEAVMIQPDAQARPAVEKAMSFLKALGGQRVGVPIAEITYKGTAPGDGVARSKRVAIYGREGSTFLAFDIDRVNYNAQVLFDWAKETGRTLPYTGVNDPAFIADVQTYVRNHAEGRRGSGEPLSMGGEAPVSSGPPVATLPREKEQFLSILMGQAAKPARTARSAVALARQAATARASGVEPLPFTEGSIEPNELRDAYRKAGAPLEAIGRDPDPERRQANPENRNEVLMRLAARGLLDFKLTGQNTSIPNSRAYEASFQPSGVRSPATLEDFKKGNVKGLLEKSGWAIATAENPDARALSPEENAARNAGLERFLKSEGLEYAPVKGSYGRPENSFVILDPSMNVDKAAALAARFGQESVLTREGLVYQDGSITPARGIQEFNTRPDDFFTEFGDSFFSADLDFDTRIQRDSAAGQTARAEEALSLAVPKASPSFQPSGALEGLGAGVLPEEARVSSAWVAPDGRIFPLRTESHQRWALRVLGLGSEPRKGAGAEAESRLKELGWTRVSEDATGSGSVFVEKFGVLTPKQEKALAEWRDANPGTDFVQLRGVRFQPSGALAQEKVKGSQVQFKSKPKEGSKQGVIDLVHFSSKTLKEIDPKKSFGKGAATPTDRQGMNKAFFYVKGTAYEGPIAVRPNVYEAQVDGNSLYDYNEDVLDVRSIVNREKRDQAIRDAGFVGYFVETPGFDAVAIFEPIKVKASLRQEVMTPRQMRNLGLEKQEAADPTVERRAAILSSPAFKRAEARIAERVGSRSNGAFFDALDAWVEKRLAAEARPARARRGFELSRRPTPEQKAARFVGLTTSTPRFQPSGELAGESVRKAKARDPLGLFPQVQRTLAAIPEKANRQQIEAAFRDGVKDKGKIVERPVRKEEIEDTKTPDGTSLAQFLKDNPTAGLNEIKDFVRDASVKLDRVVLQGPGQRWEFDGETYETEREAERAREEAMSNAYESAYDQEVEYRSARVSRSEDAVVADDGDTEVYTVRKSPSEGPDDLEAGGRFDILDADGDVVSPDIQGDDLLRELRNLASDYNNSLQIEVDEYGLDVPDIEEVGSEEGGVQYEDYTLRGRESDSYKEVLFTVEGGAYPGYTSNHFKDQTDNYLAHARVDDGHRTKDGKSVYLVEEIQSDRHQAARDNGYDITPPPPTPERYRELSAALDANYERQAALDSAASEAASVLGRKTQNIADRFRAAASALLPGNEIVSRMSDGMVLEMLQAAKAKGKDASLVTLGQEYEDAVKESDAPFFAAQRNREERVAIRREMDPVSTGSVPDAPFKKSWKEMVFKSLLTEAAQEGKDVFAWTPGDAQAARYSNALQKAVDTVETKKNPDGTYDASFYKNTRVVSEEKGVTATRLSDLVGKAAATKIVTEADSANGEFATIDGADLSVGGEGMRAVYDRVLVNFANDYLKKYGVKVGEIQLDLPKADSSANVNAKVWGFQIPQQLKDDVAAEGLPRYQPSGSLASARVGQRSGRGAELSAARVTDEDPQE